MCFRVGGELISSKLKSMSGSFKTCIFYFSKLVPVSSQLHHLRNWLPSVSDVKCASAKIVLWKNDSLSRDHLCSGLGCCCEPNVALSSIRLASRSEMEGTDM